MIAYPIIIRYARSARQAPIHQDGTDAVMPTTNRCHGLSVGKVQPAVRRHTATAAADRNLADDHAPVETAR